jgi:hypothetical protein
MYHYIYIIVIPGCKGCFVFEWTPGCHFQHQAEAVEPKLTNEQLPSYPALNNPGGWEDPVASIKLGHFR